MGAATEKARAASAVCVRGTVGGAENAGVENAGVENAAPSSKGGKRGSGKLQGRIQRGPNRRH